MITIKNLMNNWTPEFRHMYVVAGALFPGYGHWQEDNPIYLFTDFLADTDSNLLKLEPVVADEVRKEQCDRLAELGGSLSHDSNLYLFSNEENIFGFLADHDDHLKEIFISISIRLVLLRQCYREERFLANLERANEYFEKFDVALIHVTNSLLDDFEVGNV